MTWLHYTLLGLQGFSAFLTIMLVLLHSPKSDGVGVMGGVTSSFATQRGAESTLNTITRYAVAVFLIVSFILGYYF